MMYMMQLDFLRVYKLTLVNIIFLNYVIEK